MYHSSLHLSREPPNMISYIHASTGYFLLNYVDDFIGAEYYSLAFKAHASLIHMMSSIGVDRSAKKSVPPTQIIEFVGTLFNTIDMTIGITPARRSEIMKELEGWRWKTVVTRRDLECLIGKLQFLSNCVRSGCLFVSRLLNEMKGMQRGVWYDVTEEARKDILWWYSFLPQFKGTSVMWMLNCAEMDAEMSVDACLVGAGGLCENTYYRLRFPKHILAKKHSIVHLEMWAVIIAIRAWGDLLRGKYITIRSDNEAVTAIINTGRSFDVRLQKQLRELVWWLAKYDMNLRSVHLPGKLNRIPDLLSRWSEGLPVHSEFKSRTEGLQLTRTIINYNWFQFAHEW